MKTGDCSNCQSDERLGAEPLLAVASGVVTSGALGCYLLSNHNTYLPTPRFALGRVYLRANGIQSTMWFVRSGSP